MSIISTEEIITKLSTKFNKIFYDRDFICSVQEDFEVILKNTKKCCVVIFPVLGPHYLKAVQYQARILNLAAFTLGTDKITSVAVCHRDFLMKKLVLDKEKMHPKEPDDIKTRQKRPERQLYVPPAQRCSRLQGNVTKPGISRRKGEEIPAKNKKPSRRKTESCVDKNVECDKSECSERGALENDDRKCYLNSYQYSECFFYPHLCWVYVLCYNDVRNSINLTSLRKIMSRSGLDVFKQGSIKFSLFSYTREHVLFILKNEILLWQPESVFIESTKSTRVFRIYSQLDFSNSEELAKENDFMRIPSVLYCSAIQEDNNKQVYESSDLIWVKDKHFNNCSLLDTFYNRYYYLVDDCAETERQSFDIWLQNLEVSIINNNKEETHTSVVYPSDYGDCEKESKQEDYPLLVESVGISISVSVQENNSPVEEITPEMSVVEYSETSILENTQNCDPSDTKLVPDSFVVGSPQGNNVTYSIPENSLEESTQNINLSVTEIVPEICQNESKQIMGVSVTDIAQNSELTSPQDTNVSVEKVAPIRKAVKSVLKVSGDEKKTVGTKIIKTKDDHDEEKEIMRKTKENINRKSRPIMKYVDNNDELKIGEDDDNVNNWEDLFDESGQLHENIMKEIFHKVGNEVTIVKAKEDYSDYSVKQLEELEHMVELYDFPETLETNDLIHIFSDINSDAMYIKWVDNTHAILVLGSLTQAQKALGKHHPLVKVRPMSAASNASLTTAYKYDLKPAMKRPPTNLQTARRMITSHLGTKSNVSQERSAKERNDIKQAKEMKRLIKKNEEDAWEGNLRSSLN